MTISRIDNTTLNPVQGAQDGRGMKRKGSEGISENQRPCKIQAVQVANQSEDLKKTLADEIQKIVEFIPSRRLIVAVKDLREDNIIPSFCIKKLGATILKNAYDQMVEQFYFDDRLRKFFKKTTDKSAFKEMDSALHKCIQLARFINGPFIKEIMDRNLVLLWEHISPLVGKEGVKGTADQIRQWMQNDSETFDKVVILNLCISNMQIIPVEVYKIKNLKQVVLLHSNIWSYPRVFYNHPNAPIEIFMD